MPFFRTFLYHFRTLRLFQSAAALTLISLLAFVPLLTLMLMLSHIFPPVDVLTDSFSDFVNHVLIPHSAEQAADYITLFKHRAVNAGHSGLLMLLGLVFLLARALEQTFNHIWQVRHRDWHKSALLYVSLLAFPLALGAAFLLEQQFAQGSLPRFAVGSSILFLVLGLLYRFIPAHPVKIRHAALGALATTLLIKTAHLGFVSYLNAFPIYKAVYGVFSAFPLFILWFNLMWILVLAGALLVALVGDLGQ